MIWLGIAVYVIGFFIIAQWGGRVGYRVGYNIGYKAGFDDLMNRNEHREVLHRLDLRDQLSSLN